MSWGKPVLHTFGVHTCVKPFSEGFVAFSRTEQLSNGLSQRRLQHLVLTSQLRPFATVFGYVCTKTWHAWEAKQSVSPRWWRDALGVNPPWNQQPTAQQLIPLWRGSVKRPSFMSFNTHHENQTEALIQVWELSMVLNCSVPECSFQSFTNPHFTHHYLYVQACAF